jgi:hypothetical protein
MPLTKKGTKILKKMRKTYGKEKGEEVFYASANKGKIKGVHAEDVEKYATPEEKQFLKEYQTIDDTRKGFKKRTWDFNDKIASNAKLNKEYSPKDEQMVNYDYMVVYFDYPLESPVPFVLRNFGGFTKQQFLDAVREKYKEIYADPEKYPTWGHDIGDLYLEGARESEAHPGVFKLDMGS